MKYKNLHIYMSSSDSTGCSHYRVAQPSQFLNKHYPNVQFHEGFPIADRLGHEWADVIIAQRINHEHFLKLIPYLQSIGKKFVLDMDDNLFEIPHGNLARKHYDKPTLDRITKIIGMCDAIICSTEPLAHFYSRWNKNIFISPNMIKDVYPFREHTKKDKTRVGWAGSYTHAFEFSDQLDGHLAMLNKYGKIQSVVAGFDGKLPPQPNRKIPGLFKFSEKHPWQKSSEWMDYLNTLELDIGYAVVQENVFNECKSDIKFVEYSACSIPMIAATSWPYDNSIVHGETGFIVKNNKTDWKEYINLLIEDVDLRNSIALKAWKQTKYNRTYTHAGYKTLKIYENVFSFLFEGDRTGIWNNYDIEYIGKNIDYEGES